MPLIHLLYRIHLPNVVVPVDIKEGRHQHDISGIKSLKSASSQNSGFSGIVEDQNKDCNIIFFVPITDPILVTF